MIHTTNKYELSYFDVNQNTLPKCEANTSLPHSRKTKKLRTKQNNNNNTSMQKSSLTLSVVLLYIIDPWAQTSSANNMKYSITDALAKITDRATHVALTSDIPTSLFSWGGGGDFSGLTSAGLFYVCILLQINIDAATIAYYTKNGVLFYKEKPTLQSLSEQDKATHTIIHTITHNGITSIILSVLYACCILTQTTINKFVPYIRKNKLYGCSDIKFLHLSFYNMQRHRMYMLLHCHRKPTR